jgi:pantetheine-phosphate adenylyltransferase
MFDPPTLAHLTVVETALRMFDRLIVVVGVNLAKSRTMFSTDERVKLFQDSLPADLQPQVTVLSYDGLTAPFAERLGACALVRGMRPVTDPEYEIGLALMNAKLAPNLPTVLLVARAENIYLSSTFVRETASLDGRIVPGTVPAPVEEALRARFGHMAARRAAAQDANRHLLGAQDASAARADAPPPPATGAAPRTTRRRSQTPR